MSSNYISKEVRSRISKEAGNRCGYCLSPQQYVLGTLEIDHIIPASRGGTNDDENLWLSCRSCNNYKSNQSHAIDPDTENYVSLFNPRQQKWSNHFEWSKDGIRIIGKTACGRATVIALQINNETAMMVRSHWVSAGWHPPKSE